MNRPEDAGSLDDRQVELINMADYALLVLVDETGHVRTQSKGDRAWAAETLRRIADEYERTAG